MKSSFLRHHGLGRFVLVAIVWGAIGSSVARAVYWNNDPLFGATSTDGLTDRVAWFKNTYVVRNETNGSRGSATLLNSEWLLTAGHVVKDASSESQVASASQVFVDVNGTPYYGNQIYTPDDGTDLALVRVNQVSTSAVLDLTNNLNSEFDEAGRVLQFGGYGNWGQIETTAYDGNVAGTTNSSVEFHRAYNTGVIFNGNQIRIFADAEPTLTNNGLLEGIAGSGDSGGPLFAFYGTDFATQGSNPNYWRLAGVTVSSSATKEGASLYHASDYVRVASYYDWIIDTMASAPVPGDLDGDGDVDGADFVIWQTNFPQAAGATSTTGDADGDSDVDGADFVVWQSSFPYTPAGPLTVPEPAAGLLFIAGLACLAYRGRKVVSFRRAA